MQARIISVGTTAFMVGAIFTLLARDAFFGNGPVSISLQVLGFALAGWARITFGFHSFRFTANPTRDYHWPVPLYSQPHLRRRMAHHVERGCGALVTDECDAGGRSDRDVNSKNRV